MRQSDSIGLDQGQLVHRVEGVGLGSSHRVRHPSNLVGPEEGVPIQVEGVRVRAVVELAQALRSNPKKLLRLVAVS